MVILSRYRLTNKGEKIKWKYCDVTCVCVCVRASVCVCVCVVTSGLPFRGNFTTLTAALLPRQLSYSQSPLLRTWSTLGKFHPVTCKQTCANHASSPFILWLGSYPNQHWRVSFDLRVLASPPDFSLSNIFLWLTDCDFPLYFPKRLDESLFRCNYFLPINTSTKSKG